MYQTLFKEPHHFFFNSQVGNTVFNIRSMQPGDLSTIHEWVNKPYAHRFWNMQGSLEELTKAYHKQKEESTSSTFLVCHNIQPIALFEVYQVISSELALKYEACMNDFGIHLLMAPHAELLPLKKELKKVSEHTLLTVLDMLFTYNSVKRVVAEPDAQNLYACRLAEQAGFRFMGEIELIEKKANLYMITKEQHIKQRSADHS